MNKVLERATVAPFEIAIGIVLLVIGIATAAHWGPSDPVDLLLPAWEVYLLAAVAFLSGLLVSGGVLAASRAVESAGLLLLCGSLVSRLVLYAIYLGLDTTLVLTGTLDIGFVAAAGLRLTVIRRQRVVIGIGKDKSTNVVAAADVDPRSAGPSGV